MLYSPTIWEIKRDEVLKQPAEQESIGNTTLFLLDGGNVAAEIKDDAVAGNYVWGANLILNKTSNSYYLYNAHGDVVNLTGSSGAVTRTYDYDAFGNEKNPNASDTNPFRYCGEYFDKETGTYYLRARYYDPEIARFTQRDTHWNTANMIYGDNPQKINEREDKLGLKSYSYTPQISAVMQSGNLYVYCGNNPIARIDTTGQDWKTVFWAGLAVAAVGIAAIAAIPTGGGSLALAGAGITAAAATTAAEATAAAGLAAAGGAIVYASQSPDQRGHSGHLKDGNRIDYEYNGNGTGNIHIHVNGKKIDLWNFSNGSGKYCDISKAVQKIIGTDEAAKIIKNFIKTIISLSGGES